MDKKQLIELEKQHQSGSGQVVTEIKKIQIRRVPRKYALPLANLARRNNLILLGLKLLQPIVRPMNPLTRPATEDEKGEYSVLLYKVGAINEALSLLNSVGDSENPSILYAKFSILFSQWNYKMAIPLVLRYVESPSLNHYKRNVGKINLASAYIETGQYQEAKAILSSLQNELDPHLHRLLSGNMQELLAALYYHLRDLNRSQVHLSQARELLKSTANYSSLMVDKLELMIRIKENKSTAQLLNGVNHLNQKAFQLKHWMTLRECDFFRAQITHDDSYLRKVLFGTPIDCYRERILREWQGSVDFQKPYIWQLNENRPSNQLFSLSFILSEKDQLGLKYGDLLHKLFVVLTSDFYCPLSQGTIFTALFPEEYYNPESGPARVHQSISRLRKWFILQKIPINVVCQRGCYFLKSQFGFALELPWTNFHINRKERLKQQLFSRFGAKAFTSKEAANTLAVSKSQILSLLGEYVSQGDLIVVGRGRATKYSKAS